MSKYRILDMTPTYVDPYSRRPQYNWYGSFPWVNHLPTEHRDPEKAYAEAEQWAKDWEIKDRLGNMAHAAGVSQRSTGPGEYLYRGVVSYYHSNT